MTDTGGPRGALAGLLALLDDALPLLKYFGFAFWVAWFGVAYTSSVWVENVEETAWVVSDMFFASTAAHALILLAFAAFAKRVAVLASRPWFVLAGGIAASCGCVLVIAAGPEYLYSQAAFYAGSVLTGVGTAALSLNAGLLLCAIRPRQALRIILQCELLAALMQFMVLGLPGPVDAACFVALPLLSAACFVVGCLKRVVPAVQESQRLKPVKSFGRFLVVVGILSVAANFSRGTHQMSVSPTQLAVDGSITAFATVVLFAAVAVVVAVRAADLNFGHLFYPMALALIFSLLVSYFFPDTAAAAVVLSGVAFQLFDAVMWYMFSYVVYQSKASAILVVCLGRAVIAAGVTVGNALGALGADWRMGDAPLSAVVFVLLFAAAVAVFFIFPEKQVDRMLLPIPDEDEPGASPMEEGDDEAERAAADGDGDGPSRKGRWKRLCLQLGDEAQLTEREKEVFVLLARGFGSQSISDELTVSLYTTRAHTRNIYAKLGVHSRQELAERVREYVRSRS
ncbi:helix-turn-helix transcriptional regulator [Arabiibacter massiliensis]|uniref:helix-turn-helix transcriptional regulator n=1 Tax=Arabiibacter massiliensis TaxID=1870985 RepID=UPI000B4241E2|nr:LuxR C-terminal-related transcriptional regulator [Arabiibacter massiliensis]